MAKRPGANVGSPLWDDEDSSEPSATPEEDGRHIRDASRLNPVAKAMGIAPPAESVSDAAEIPDSESRDPNATQVIPSQENVTSAMAPISQDPETASVPVQAKKKTPRTTKRKSTIKKARPVSFPAESASSGERAPDDAESVDSGAPQEATSVSRRSDTQDLIAEEAPTGADSDLDAPVSDADTGPVSAPSAETTGAIPASASVTEVLKSLASPSAGPLDPGAAQDLPDVDYDADLANLSVDVPELLGTVPEPDANQTELISPSESSDQTTVFDQESSQTSSTAANADPATPTVEDYVVEHRAAPQVYESDLSYAGGESDTDSITAIRVGKSGLDADGFDVHGYDRFGFRRENYEVADLVTKDEGPGYAAEEVRELTTSQKWLRRIFIVVRDQVVILTMAIVIALVMKTFLVQLFYIPSGSMEPTLELGDRVVVNKVVPQALKLQRGDVVVFQDEQQWLSGISQEPPSSGVPDLLRRALTAVGLLPEDLENHLIKRVIGIGGDTIECCDPQGRILVNGVPIDEPYVISTDVPSLDEFEVTVPQDQIWVMGDYRSNSLDSRYHRDVNNGMIMMDDVVGRAIFVAWPWQRIHFLSGYHDQFPDS